MQIIQIIIHLLSAYHLYGNFGENFFVKWYWYFVLAPKTGTGLTCSLYKIPVNFSLSLSMKPHTGNPNKWYRKFRSFRWEREKGNTSKCITFFLENFHRDKPFHLNSPWNFQVFHTNGEPFLTMCSNYYTSLIDFFQGNRSFIIYTIYHQWKSFNRTTTILMSHCKRRTLKSDLLFTW